ncbi:MAG: energy-coupling factor transporter transmembrane protein EcfT [Clostridia bacterium]|nr:energy-coupling factor transporter transmembrane protein EcfT [Clostridia bacterium]
MMRDITLGQFFPGNSPLHRLDPRMKIILTVAYIVAVFLADSVGGYALLILFTAFLVSISGIKVSVVLRGVRPLIYVIAFTSIVNIFFTVGDTPLHLWKITIYLEGIVTAAFRVERIWKLLIGTSGLLTHTTTPIALTDAIERLLSPLRVIHVPVHEFAMMMTIALRFIPTLLKETDKIMSAQKARGADFSTGKLIDRAKALIPILIPLIISAFRSADELATAMECRCYRGGNGRTRMTCLKLSAIDFVGLFVMAAFIVGVLAVNVHLPVYTV